MIENSVFIISATKCKTCGQAFIIDSNEHNWIERKGMHERNHCETCISNRKESNNAVFTNRHSNRLLHTLAR